MLSEVVLNGCVGGVRVVPPFGMYFSDFLHIISLFKMRKGGKEILEWSNSARKWIKILLNPNFFDPSVPGLRIFSALQVYCKLYF